MDNDPNQGIPPAFDDWWHHVSGMQGPTTFVAYNAIQRFCNEVEAKATSSMLTKRSHREYAVEFAMKRMKEQLGIRA